MAVEAQRRIRTGSSAAPPAVVLSAPAPADAEPPEPAEPDDSPRPPATAEPALPSTELVPWRPEPDLLEALGPRPARYGLQMPRRSPALMWLMQTLTLGAGHIRWLRRVNRELGELDVQAEVNLRRTTLAVVPGVLLVVPALVAWYRLGRRIARAQYAAGLEPTCRPGRGLLTAVLFGTVTWYYQAELNKIVDWYGWPPGVAVPLYD